MNKPVAISPSNVGQVTRKSTVSSRMIWVDAARGVGIVLVVGGHVWRGLNNSNMLPDKDLFAAIDNFIYLFHMPLFFFLSGLFFAAGIRSRGVMKSIWNRMLLILYPLILWSYVHSVSSYMGGSDVNHPLSLHDVAVAPFPPRDHFWFLGVLFISQTLISGAYLFKDKRVVTALIIGAAIVALGLDALYEPWQLPLLVNRTVVNLPYFCVGILYMQFGFGWNRSGLTALVGVLAFAVAEIVVLAYPDQVTGIFESVLAVLCVIGLTEVIMWASQNWGKSRLGQFVCVLGAASMAIYVMHILFASTVRILMVRADITDISTHMVVGIFLGLFAPLAVLYVARRYGLATWIGLGR